MPKTEHNLKLCNELLDLSDESQREFLARQDKIAASNNFPADRWYNDMDFCRAYNTAIYWKRLVKSDKIAVGRGVRNFVDIDY